MDISVYMYKTPHYNHIDTNKITIYFKKEKTTTPHKGLESEWTTHMENLFF